jgi:hypothetical protein
MSLLHAVGAPALAPAMRRALAVVARHPSVEPDDRSRIVEVAVLTLLSDAEAGSEAVGAAVANTAAIRMPPACAAAVAFLLSTLLARSVEPGELVGGPQLVVGAPSDVDRGWAAPAPDGARGGGEAGGAPAALVFEGLTDEAGRADEATLLHCAAGLTFLCGRFAPFAPAIRAAVAEALSRSAREPGSVWRAAATMDRVDAAAFVALAAACGYGPGGAAAVDERTLAASALALMLERFQGAAFSGAAGSGAAAGLRALLSARLPTRDRPLLLLAVREAAPLVEGGGEAASAASRVLAHALTAADGGRVGALAAAIANLRASALAAARASAGSSASLFAVQLAEACARFA